MSNYCTTQKAPNATGFRGLPIRILLAVSISLLSVACSGNCESYDEFGGCEIYSGESQTEFDATIIGQLFLILVAGLLLLALILKIQKKMFIRKHKLQAFIDDLQLQGWYITVTANKLWRPSWFFLHAECKKHFGFEPQSMRRDWTRMIVGSGDATKWEKKESIRCRACYEGLPSTAIEKNPS